MATDKMKSPYEVQCIMGSKYCNVGPCRSFAHAKNSMDRFLEMNENRKGQVRIIRTDNNEVMLEA